MSALPPPTVPPPPAVPKDNFLRNLIIVIVLGIAAFGGYKTYENKQDTEHFRQHQVEQYRKALNGD